jgi:hypothetical protein
MVDPNRIFGLFDDNSGSDNSYDSVSTYIDIKDTAEYRIGMFTRIIMDHLKFNEKVLDFFSKASNDLEREDIALAGEFVVYNRGWFYVKNINVEEAKDWYALEKMANLKTLSALELSIHFFEEREEYEKCAHLFKLSKVIKEFLN